jgi:hypothetical protein
MTEPDTSCHMIKHFVVTRFGLGVYSSHWHERMIDLLEFTTYASLANQASRDFIWLVAVDSQMPASARARMAALFAQPHFHLVPIEVSQVRRMHHGSFDWVWDHCADYILERQLVTDPSQYVITSLIDADDAWDREAISTINAFVDTHLPAACINETRRGHPIRHTSGVVATFPLGFRWYAQANVAESFHYPFLSMGVFVAARFSSGISACSSRHGLWPAFAKVMEFDTRELEPHRPMWIYTRHDRTMEPWDARDVAATPALRLDILGQQFGIDVQKYQRWCAAGAHEQSGALSPMVHNGCSGADQNDRMFKIVSLNRQIDALARSLDGPDMDASDIRALLASRTAQRASLIAEFQHAGRTHFR